MRVFALRPETVERIKGVIEAAGVEFVGGSDDRAGVRLHPQIR